MCLTGTVFNSVDNLIESIVADESLLLCGHYVSDIVDSLQLLNRLDEFWLGFSLCEAEQADPFDPLIDLELVVGPLCIVPGERVRGCQEISACAIQKSKAFSLSPQTNITCCVFYFCKQTCIEQWHNFVWIQLGHLSNVHV